MLTPITQYGWPPHQHHPKLMERQKRTLTVLQVYIEADEVPTKHLDPRQLVPTQETVDSDILQNLVDVEFVPAVLVLRKREQLYIHDGHHRATRALLDGQLVRSVVFDLEVITDG